MLFHSRTFLLLFSALLLLCACQNEAAPRNIPDEDTQEEDLDAFSAPEDALDTTQDTEEEKEDAQDVPDASPIVYTTERIDPEGCNGSPELCQRRYDDVAYPTTHNAMSNAEEGWHIPNQSHSILRQLHAGVRAMMLDVYEFRGEILLCHALCQLGSTPLSRAFSEIALFLEEHPTEVITLILESYVEPEAVHRIAEESGLRAFAWIHNEGEPWPTLQKMIQDNKRLVLLSDTRSPDHPWQHYLWDHAWELHYSYETPEDFHCRPNRGDQDNALFVFNHFLTEVSGKLEFAQRVNHNPLLINRVNECTAEHGTLPNFLTVDFYEEGDLFEAVDAINRRE